MLSKSSPVKLLFIDGSPAEAAALKATLQPSICPSPSLGTYHHHPLYSLIHVSQIQPVLEALLSHSFDVILLGLAHLDRSPLEAIRAIQENLPQIPLIVVDRQKTLSTTEICELMRQGVQDYWDSQFLDQGTQYLAGSIEQAIGRHQQRRPLDRATTARSPLSPAFLAPISETVIILDTQGRVQHLNPAAERFTGWLTEMAQGHSIQEILQVLGQDCTDSVHNLVVATLRGQRPLDAPGLMVLNHRHSYPQAMDLSITPLESEAGVMEGVMVVGREVTPTRRLASQLVWQASHDALTGLINRSEFEFYLEKAVNHAQLTQATHILGYLDLDQFKVVNDTCGHSTGDELLRQVSRYLQSHLKKTDMVARLGGDEFGILLHNVSLEEGQKRMQHLVSQLSQMQFLYQNRLYQVKVSAGIVTIDNSWPDKAALLSAADTALYAAKDRGGSRCQTYQTGDRELEQRQGDMRWVSHLTQALEENLFVLDLQPIVDLRSLPSPGHPSAVSGLPRSPQDYNSPYPMTYEVLIRLKGADGQPIYAGSFIPAAERYNLMPTIDRWVISTLFKFLSQLPPLPALQHITYNVNLSGASFNDEQFVDFVHQQFEIHRVSPTQICFEVTETVAIAHLSKAVEFIQPLRKLGCRFALDDFGSGMSSLTYLNTLPVDYLKIDGKLVRPLDRDSVCMAMIEGIVHISSAMGLAVVAEFVENQTILEKVQQLGIDYAQGYGVAKSFSLTDLPQIYHHPLALWEARNDRKVG